MGDDSSGEPPHGRWKQRSATSKAQPEERHQQSATSRAPTEERRLRSATRADGGYIPGRNLKKRGRCRVHYAHPILAQSLVWVSITTGPDFSPYMDMRRPATHNANSPLEERGCQGWFNPIYGHIRSLGAVAKGLVPQIGSREIETISRPVNNHRRIRV